MTEFTLSSPLRSEVWCVKMGSDLNVTGKFTDLILTRKPRKFQIDSSKFTIEKTPFFRKIQTHKIQTITAIKAIYPTFLYQVKKLKIKSTQEPTEHYKSPLLDTKFSSQHHELSKIYWIDLVYEKMQFKTKLYFTIRKLCISKPSKAISEGPSCHNGVRNLSATLLYYDNWCDLSPGWSV